jgi:hypothetical protein
MKYNLIIIKSETDKSVTVWNQHRHNEWQIVFESMTQAQDFMVSLISAE